MTASLLPILDCPPLEMTALQMQALARPLAGPTISPLLAVLPLQLLAYYIIIARGYDPDFPHNLSKTLTVV